MHRHTDHIMRGTRRDLCQCCTACQRQVNADKVGCSKTTLQWCTLQIKVQCPLGLYKHAGGVTSAIYKHAMQLLVNVCVYHTACNTILRHLHNTCALIPRYARSI